MKEVGEKKRQQEVEGARGAPMCPIIWSMAQPQLMCLGAQGRDGCWYSREEPPSSAGSQLSESARGEHPCAPVQREPPAPSISVLLCNGSHQL